MYRTARALLFVIVAIVSTAVITGRPVHAASGFTVTWSQPNTVATTTVSSGGIEWPRLGMASFYSAGRNWFFFDSDETPCDFVAGVARCLHFTSSVGSQGWASPTNVNVANDHFVVVSALGSVFYARANVTGCVGQCPKENVLFRQGTPNSDGTITWSPEHQVITNTTSGNFNYRDLSLGISSTGTVFVTFICNAFENNICSNDNMSVATSNGSDYTTWTTSNSALVNFHNACVQFTALTNGKMYASCPTGNEVDGYFYDGANWGSPETISAIFPGITFFSPDNTPNEINLVFTHLEQGAYLTTHIPLHSLTRDPISGTWGTEGSFLSLGTIYTISEWRAIYDPLSFNYFVINKTGSGIPGLFQFTTGTITPVVFPNSLTTMATENNCGGCLLTMSRQADITSGLTSAIAVYWIETGSPFTIKSFIITISQTGGGCFYSGCVPPPPSVSGIPVFYPGPISAGQLLPNINWPNVSLAPFAAFFALVAGSVTGAYMLRSPQQDPFQGMVGYSEHKKIKLGRRRKVRLK